ncbi:MAG: ATP-dependent DNA helicase RecG [Oscillospiraceae bacterium]|nr:ATP-dependent DNA helicase RecG [Oscillospiraceae bacterium]
MADLQTDIRYMKGIGDVRAKALNKLGITSLGDLITTFPRAYDDRRQFAAIQNLTPGETVSVRAIVANEPRLQTIRRGLDLLKFRAVDESGSLEVAFFNQGYRKDQIKKGESYVFYGKVGGTLLAPAMQNPVMEQEADAGRLTGRIVPIYRLTQGVSQTILLNAMTQGLIACGDLFPDPLPEAVREAHGLAQTRFAYHNIHFPESEEALQLARRRLIFEELFLLAASLHLIRGRREGVSGRVVPAVDLAPFYAALPFSLTGAQKRAIGDALADMAGDRPMSRLVQGDVGSGKTVVAAAAAWAAFRAGYQSAFMAPTEILAEQHYQTLSTLLEPLGMRVGLLKGSMGAKQKREMGALIESGFFHLVVGTHALISEDVRYHNLALVITDEQHRFGVDQRSALKEKGDHPHMLVMSATPIPRTLALILYGDLDISIIDELPPGRQAVETYAVDESKRERIYNFTRKLLDEGRQAYYVCPAIEVDPDDVSGGMKAVEAYAKRLQEEVFPDRKVAFLHGKLKAKDKEKIMSAFSKGETDILVSTTVIEVGVDVPNAALMVIENAEHFGLSQLHQLRGRVGRGKHQSYCVLFSSNEAESVKARLAIMCQTGDGFQIAEEDLRLRGPGDFFGSRQHGLPEMGLASFTYNMDVLKEAQSAAMEVLARDPRLEAPGHEALRVRIQEMFAIGADSFH